MSKKLIPKHNKGNQILKQVLVDQQPPEIGNSEKKLSKKNPNKKLITGKPSTRNLNFVNERPVPGFITYPRIVSDNQGYNSANR